MKTADKIKAKQLDSIYLNIEASVIGARRYLKDPDNDFKCGSYQIINTEIRKSLNFIDNILDLNTEPIIIYKSASIGPTGSFQPLVCLKGYTLLSKEQSEEISEIMLNLKQKCYEFKIHAELTINK